LFKDAQRDNDRAGTAIAAAAKTEPAGTDSSETNVSQFHGKRGA
jgi:hypothetical protein